LKAVRQIELPGLKYVLCVKAETIQVLKSMIDVELPKILSKMSFGTVPIWSMSVKIHD